MQNVPFYELMGGTAEEMLAEKSRLCIDQRH
jgi:hypothetical protein